MIKILIELLKKHEGYRSKVYLCSEGKRTIGYGHNLDACSYYVYNNERIEIANKITKKEAELILEFDIENCINDVDRLKLDIDSICEPRQAVILDMLFNLGLHRLSGFKKFIYYIRVKNFDMASVEMMDSKWAIQVGIRAEELRDIMISGEYNGL